MLKAPKNKLSRGDDGSLPPSPDGSDVATQGQSGGKRRDDGGFETLVKLSKVFRTMLDTDFDTHLGVHPDASFDPVRGQVAAFDTNIDTRCNSSFKAGSDADERLSSPSMPRGPSLKARAVAYLSRREHARDELARKLRPYAEDPSEVEAVLDALQREGWQSNERFAHGLVHRRAPLRGTARIVQELRQHGVDDALVAEASAQLKATELDRARAVWAKRYAAGAGAQPADRNEYARQARFLAGRGFSPEIIRRVLGDSEDEI